MNALEGYISPQIRIYNSHEEVLRVHKNESDSHIWAAFKAGDEAAFESIFKKHYDLLLNYGLKFNNSEADVKDYIQQLFSKLWESKSRLGQNNSIKGYLLASLRRMILRGSKSRPKFFTIQKLTPSFNLSVSVENRFFKNEREKDQVAYVAKLVAKLPKRQKEAIFLKYYGDHKFEEIAEIMGISIRVVYKLIYKAMANLSGQIGDKRATMDILMHWDWFELALKTEWGHMFAGSIKRGLVYLQKNPSRIGKAWFSSIEILTKEDTIHGFFLGDW